MWLVAPCTSPPTTHPRATVSSHPPEHPHLVPVAGLVQLCQRVLVSTRPVRL